MGCCADSLSLEKTLSLAKWRVRDVAADSKYQEADSEKLVRGLKLELQPSEPENLSVWSSACAVIDKSGRDRAVTLALTIPFDAVGWTWWDDPQQSKTISGKKPYSYLVDTGCGSTGYSSKYPLAVISNGQRALVLAVPIDLPRLVAFVYDPAKKEFRAEFDFGLSDQTKYLPSRADAAVIAYEVPAKWAFRQALAKYYEIYPKAFERKVKKSGIWIPFTPLNKIEKPEELGIAFREAGSTDPEHIAADKTYGVETYVYVEPQSNWRGLRGDAEKSYQAYVDQLWEDALQGDLRSQATITSSVERENARMDIYLEGAPYTKSVPFGVNCDPELSTENWGKWPNKGTEEIENLARMLGWRNDPPIGLSGVYFDSMEGWGTLQDYNRSHWKNSRYPLTFNPVTKRISMFNFWGNYAFAKAIADQLHEKKMLLMGNDAFFRFWQLAPIVDIPGREYSWLDEKLNFLPLPDFRFLYLRAMSGKKPYLMLMNNEFDNGDFMEAHFQRCMFYAVYPSMFRGHSRMDEVPYFENPKWYNRDRHLFVKYIPLIRQLDFAGWEPVPYADVEPGNVRIERYGSFEKKDLAFTLYNPEKKAANVTLKLSKKDLGLSDRVSATEWITEKHVTAVCRGSVLELIVELPAEGYAAIGVGD